VPPLAHLLAVPAFKLGGEHRPAARAVQRHQVGEPLVLLRRPRPFGLGLRVEHFLPCATDARARARAASQSTDDEEPELTAFDELRGRARGRGKVRGNLPPFLRVDFLAHSAGVSNTPHGRQPKRTVVASTSNRNLASSSAVLYDCHTKGGSILSATGEEAPTMAAWTPWSAAPAPRSPPEAAPRAWPRRSSSSFFFKKKCPLLFPLVLFARALVRSQRKNFAKV